MNHIILSFLFYNFLLIIVYRHYKKGHYYIDKYKLAVITLLLILFGTYGTGEGDYLHYKENIKLFDTFNDVTYYHGMEIQYNYLAYVVGGNYTLWRLIIFAIQFVGMSWLLYKAKLNTYPVLLSFIAICLLLYTYQRSYWGVIFYFLGFYLLLKKKNPLFFLVILLCYVSHTQNIVLLALIPLGFTKIRNTELLLVILFMGVIATALKDSFTSYIESGGIEDAEYLNGKIQQYSGSGISYFGSSIGEFVIFLLRYIPVVIILFFWLKIILIKRNRYLALYKPYMGLLNITIGVVITAIVVLFASLGSGTFFYRVLSMSLFPISILLPYMVASRTIKKSSYHYYVLVYILVAEFSYLKDVYYAYVHGIT